MIPNLFLPHYPDQLYGESPCWGYCVHLVGRVARAATSFKRSSEAATCDQLLQGVAGNRVILLDEACQGLETRVVGIACRVEIGNWSALWFSAANAPTAATYA